MGAPAYIIGGIYLFALTYVTIYCLMQFHLLLVYKKNQIFGKGDLEIDHIADKDLPYITIQLPIFNEMYVVERLLDNITSLDYPKDKLDIQVLDDSTDATVELSENKVNEYKAKGYNIELITRTDRSGFKAGALKEATLKARGEFIAIFDADFLPNKDFLRRTIPEFKNPKVGVVQTRWEHINQNYSILTKLQAFQLNVHFSVEQLGRESGNYLLQFNGTAGVWRKETIADAGGWEADTLTEDLDLSYRAQLKGWKIHFLEHIGSPAELPAEMNGLKSQQFRWMKGGAETAKKILPTIWKANIPFGQKLHGTIHLLSSSVFLFIFTLGIFSVPLLFLINPMDVELSFLAIFLISLITLSMVYYQANVLSEWKEENSFKLVLKFLFLFPIFLSLSMGLSLHNSIAVIQGWIGKKSAFIRTPKFNISKKKDTYQNTIYTTTKLSRTTIMEGLLTLYFLFAIIAGILNHNKMFLIFHISLMLGYGTIFYFSVKHSKYKN